MTRTIEPAQSIAAQRAWSLPATELTAGMSRATLSRSRRTALITGAVGGLVLIGIPLLVDSYWLYLLSTLLAYAVAVMGARVLFGIAGIFSLAQATFVGIGAYTAAIGATTLQLSGGYELLVVLAVSVAASLLVGIPAIRVNGLRLALVTLAFGQLFQWWITNNRDISGGTQGIVVDSFFIPGVDTQDPLFLYGMCAVIAFVVTIVLNHLPRTQLGRNMAAVRESEFAARSVGVSLTKTKLAAFVIAGVCAGISGFLVAHVVGSVTPSNYDMFPSVYILVGVILGGSGSTVGAWIGAAYVSLAPPIFSAFNQDRLYVLLSGALLVALIYVLPGGLVQLGRFFVRRTPRKADVS
jgi:branched-chain amino acid transport system permease protein